MLLSTNIRKMLVDGTQWASWHGYHLPVSDEYFAIWTPIGTEMRWRPGTWLSERHQMSFFWPDAWFTIHIGYDAETGRFHNGYCDVVLPNSGYTNAAEEMIYTDLYIDVVVREDGSVYTKDHEVFDRAAMRFPIVAQSRKRSFEVLDWLEGQARTWTGPFNYIPRLLPRTDFEKLGPGEASASMRSALNGQGDNDTRRTS